MILGYRISWFLLLCRGFAHLPKIRDIQNLSFESLVIAIADQLGYRDLVSLPFQELYKNICDILMKDRYLIVVDNLETIDNYRSLSSQIHDMIGKTKTRVLMTSRERLIGISYIDDYYIEGLSERDSSIFIKEESRNRRAYGLLQADNKIQDRIFKVTKGMPLAIKLIVSQFIAGIPLDTELKRLETAKEEDLYKFIFMRLWEKISIESKKVLIATSVFASSVSRHMLQPVSKTNDDQFEKAIPELTHMSLINPDDCITNEERRYSIHPITRWFLKSPLKESWKQQTKDKE